MKPVYGLRPASERRKFERKEAERIKAARGEALEEFLRTGQPSDKVVPELIPTAETRDAVYKEVVAAIRLADRQPRGPRRNRKLDAVVAPVARLEAIERVLALDPLQRAALTPQRLIVIAGNVSPADVHARFLSVRADMLKAKEGSR